MRGLRYLRGRPSLRRLGDGLRKSTIAGAYLLSQARCPGPLEANQAVSMKAVKIHDLTIPGRPVMWRTH